MLIAAKDGTVLLGPAALQGQKLDNWASVIPESWQIEPSKHGKILVGTAGAKGYREYPGLGWTVLVRHNAEDALAPVAALRQSMLWWGLTASFGLEILAFLSSMIVMRPVRALERTATDLNSENTALATQLLKIAEVAPGVICSFKLES